MTTQLSYADFTIGAPKITGVEIHVTELATALPDGTPSTEDMRNMVEHMAAMGMIQRKPASFSMKDAFGRETIHMHPVLHDRLMARMRTAARSMERQIDQQIFGLFS